MRLSMWKGGLMRGDRKIRLVSLLIMVVEPRFTALVVYRWKLNRVDRVSSDIFCTSMMSPI